MIVYLISRGCRANFRFWCLDLGLNRPQYVHCFLVFYSCLLASHPKACKHRRIVDSETQSGVSVALLKLPEESQDNFEEIHLSKCAGEGGGVGQPYKTRRGLLVYPAATCLVPGRPSTANCVEFLRSCPANLTY